MIASQNGNAMSGMLRAGGYNLCVKILFIFLLSVIIACHHHCEFLDNSLLFHFYLILIHFSFQKR